MPSPSAADPVRPDQTPPRKEYRRDDPKISSLSLLDLQLAPAALFYIKFVDESLNGAHAVGSSPDDAQYSAQLLRRRRPWKPG